MDTDSLRNDLEGSGLEGGGLEHSWFGLADTANGRCASAALVTFVVTLVALVALVSWCATRGSAVRAHKLETETTKACGRSGAASPSAEQNFAADDESA